MALLDDLKTARDNVVAKLLTITENPKPNYSIDGQSISHADYLSKLIESEKALTQRITELEPFLYVSVVM